MKLSTEEIIGLVITLTAISMLIISVFNPFKENQALLAQSNAQMMGQLSAELNNSTEIEVTGQSVINFIDSQASYNTKITVDGTEFTGNRYSSSIKTIEKTDKYKKRADSSSGALEYVFTKVN